MPHYYNTAEDVRIATALKEIPDPTVRDKRKRRSSCTCCIGRGFKPRKPRHDLPGGHYVRKSRDIRQGNKLKFK